MLALIGLAAAPAIGAADAGVYTAAQAQRGSALYDANCAPCHGVSLQGASAIALSGPYVSSQVGGRPPYRG